MRRNVLGVVGVVLAGPAAFGQFAADRDAPAPAVMPAGFTPEPAFRSGGVEESRSRGVKNGRVDAPTPPLLHSSTPPLAAPAADHPLAVRPEHGPWMLCVRSYTGPHSRELAEEMATYVRTKYNAASYLFEKGRDKRLAEEAGRQKVRDSHAPFLEVRERARLQALANGLEFDNTPHKIRVPKVEYPEQWAVLVGGFPSMDSASAALPTVRTWVPPADRPYLLDRAFTDTSEDGHHGVIAASYLNPFRSALVVPNPADRRAASDGPPAADPLLAHWNSSEGLSLLKCPKPYTLLVKVISVPTRTTAKAADRGVLDRLLGGGKTADLLDASAKQARELATAVRGPQMRESLARMGLGAGPLDAYVLHVQTGSLVTVGAFDGPDDPELARTARVLSAMTFECKDASTGRVIGTQKMFDQVSPMPVPRVR